MRTSTPRVEPYAFSATSKFVVEGLRVDGKRTRKFFRKRRAAEAWLRKTLARVTKEGEGAIHMPEGLRVEATTLAARLHPYGRTLSDAVTHYLAHLAAVERTCTVAKLAADFEETKRADGARKTYLHDIHHRLARFCRDFGERKVAEIGSHEIDDWLRGLGSGPQSRNNCRTVLGTMFAFAVQRRFAPNNPVEHTAKARVTRGAPGIFTPADMRKLLEHASADFLPALAIGAFAGIRPAEVARLDWKDVDFTRGLIHLTGAQTKTRDRRLVALHPTLAAWLAPLSQKDGPILKGNERKLRADAMKKAEIEKWPNDGLRHSFASYHLAHFRNAAETAMQLGHQNAKMVYQHYREIVLPDDAAQWWQLTPPVDYSNVVAFRKEAANA